MSRRPVTSTIPTAIVKTMAGQHAARQVLQRAGQEQQHQQHDAGEDQLCDLAARAGAIRHRGLRRAAIDHERPAQRRGRIRRRQAEDVAHPRRRARDSARRMPALSPRFAR